MNIPKIAKLRAALTLGLFALVAPAAVLAQVKVVDMIPVWMSDETNRDSEPFLAVNPADPHLMAATAFLLTPGGSPNGPLLVSTDGGVTWGTSNVIPSSPGGLNTFDATIGFNSAGTAFYAGLLRDSTVALEVDRTTDLTFNTVLTQVNTPRATDQPYINARTVTGPPDAGKDRVWMGNNEGAVSPASATVDQSLDAGIVAPVFTQDRIDAGSPVGRDNYQVRTVSHADGHVYAAFYRRKASISGGYNADVVVVRDDNWGLTAPPFQSLVDTVTSVAGQNVVASTPVSDTLGSSAALGNEWWGGDLYLTVDPSHSERVYISYSDSHTGAERTLHLRRSTDFGHTWGADLLATPSAKNAAVAINSVGMIAYVYQQLAGAAPNLRWQTHLRRSADGTAWDDVTLADFPAQGTGAPGGSRIVGDYLNMIAVGKNFYGVFSSFNDPANASFPAGVSYLRNRTPDGAPMPRLLGIDGVTPVAPSIDPFFFSAMGLQPQIQVPGAVDLGKACVGTQSAGTLNVCNTGKDDLIVSAITSSNPRFAVTAPSAGFPVTISHDFCFPFQVVFDSAATGAQTATLTVASNDPDHPMVDVQVSGDGTEPDIRVTGSTDFGTASAWTPAEKTVAVCNTGACALSVTGASIACTDFILVNNPFPATLSPGACLSLVARFTPLTPGFKACDLKVASNDPDTPLVSRTLTARTPPFFSLHGGLVVPHGALHGVATQGSTFNLDFVYPFKPRWSWDARLGVSRFDGRAGGPDIDLANLAANAKFTVNPTGAVRLFLNGGVGLYHFNPGDFEAGGNLGLGLNVPLGRRFALEATYNHHWALTASPVLRFSQVQAGLLISF
ncbi:MAG TPA: choice-of-anchor D domain-containing protein [Thermoanaerobaculia bacterium]|jgi:hypothetical protein